MANPRKFSEKIALHTHRQAEETARFEQIMKEVSDATARPDENVLTNLPYRESRPRSQAGPIRRPHDRRLDTSPYSSGAFLSPPSDTSWRRTHSDPALHQSASQGMGVERNENANNRWMVPTMNGPEQLDGRPRSSCEVPRVPGINIYPSAHEPGTIQIPIGNNTGSLPDLTSVHFPSPIPTPIDQELDQGSSPYSSSPINTSPSTLSPTSVQQGGRQQGRFQFTSQVPHHQSNHLSVPVNSRFLHHNKGIAMDNNSTGLVDTTDFSQISQMTGMYHQRQQQQQQQQQQCSPPSPSSNAAVYRNSPRPSPQSSPSLGGRHSAPCSPGAPSPLPNDYHLFNQHQAAQFQQHFEQLSMLDPPVSSMSYMDTPTSVQMTQSHPQSMPEVSGVGNIEIGSDAGYYSTSPSQMVYQTNPGMHTAPNTPTSIPDIILTDFLDFSSGGDEFSRQDLALSKQLEAELLADETLREGLGPLDFTEIQMLSDPTMSLISDGVEDHFRLDHRS